MAFSTCPKCGGHTFERAFLTPLREQHKVAVLQCAECGTLIGVLDAPSAIQFENIQKQIAAIDAGLIRIANALSQ